ncbi:uncharacterized protein At1g66480-like [Primulina eburnea]|uniref:uncharacterized protein At1g66480-like n=1 Tax=Primulina eburnea TaxID=1245227 RepID=UPI003C6CA1D6
MGNSLGGRKSVKVMKINGETFKVKAPVQAGSVLKKYPGHVLLESEAVKHYGIRAKPLDPGQELKPKRLYFLVELPEFPEERVTRRVRSGIQMSAKDRLESLLLARRSSSDLSIMKPPSIASEEEEQRARGGGGVRVKVRLPKAEVERLMAESKSEDEVAEKIISLYMGSGSVPAAASGELRRRDLDAVKAAPKAREKRVGFMPIHEGEIQLAVAS